jgi:branched-chain amino acid aminotransferase
MEPLQVIRTNQPKSKPNEGELGFGKYFSDHMFVANYTSDRGWHNARIIPYGPISLEPSAMVLHYGQEVFEGMKAYRGMNGEINLFRPEKNIQRMNLSCDRLGIPQVDSEWMLEAICKLVEIDHDWIPEQVENSLYIRPFIIATEPCLGVRAAKEYQLLIITSPVGAYYSSGLAPVSIYVEDQYVRAVRGGTGAAKTSINYASSIKAQEEAKRQGYSQVMWLDGIEQRYIEEVGSMNVFFKVDGEVITPELNGSILPGVTRDSVIAMLKHWGIPVTERKITVEELFEAHKQGKLEEAFGTGTAAVISPIGAMKWGEQSIQINEGNIGEVSGRLYDSITGIQQGKIADPLHWRYLIG